MSESRDQATASNQNSGLKKKYGVMVLTDYGDAAKLTRNVSGGPPGPTSYPVPCTTE